MLRAAEREIPERSKSLAVPFSRFTRVTTRVLHRRAHRPIPRWRRRPRPTGCPQSNGCKRMEEENLGNNKLGSWLFGSLAGWLLRAACGGLPHPHPHPHPQPSGSRLSFASQQNGTTLPASGGWWIFSFFFWGFGCFWVPLVLPAGFYDGDPQLRAVGCLWRRLCLAVCLGQGLALRGGMEPFGEADDGSTQWKCFFNKIAKVILMRLKPRPSVSQCIHAKRAANKSDWWRGKRCCGMPLKKQQTPRVWEAE